MMFLVHETLHARARLAAEPCEVPQDPLEPYMRGTPDLLTLSTKTEKDHPTQHHQQNE